MTANRTLHIALGLVAFALVYGLVQARTFLTGPALTLVSPTAYGTVSGEVLVVEGHARNVSKLTLNGAPIFTDDTGNFRERLLVPNGYSILVVAAENRFGRTTERYVPFYGVPGTGVMQATTALPAGPTLAAQQGTEAGT